jgi:uncharacterized membrane protein YeaQ/YmgE (transglycosylase-associated protein family)
MNLALNLGLPNFMQIAIYAMVGFLVSLFVGILGRVRTPIGAFIMMLLATMGAWVVTGILNIHMGRDVYAMDVPLLSAFIGAFLFAVLSLALQPRRRPRVAAAPKRVELS